MKLELKNVAPYLPYGLKCIITYYPEKGLMDLERLSKYKVWLSNGGSVHLWQEQHIDKIKPILRPLSDLFNGNYEFILDEFSEVSLESFKIAFLSELKPLNAFDKINYTIMQLLFEWHFDVFGLIDKNLAIDINTL